MSLRVIAGSAKGKKLLSVPGDTTRPVMDRVKEALFNILQGDVIDSNWWDLFGGTAAIGIEALSRGDAHRSSWTQVDWDERFCVGGESQREMFWRLRESIPEAQRRIGAALWFN